MLTPIVLLHLATSLFSLRALKIILENTPRTEQKKKLLRLLNNLRNTDLIVLGRKCVLVTEEIFSRFLGEKIGSPSYIIRTSFMGAMVGVLLALLTGAMLSSSASDLLAWILSPRHTWVKLILVPAVASGSILFVIDILFSHAMYRWLKKGDAKRIPWAFAMSMIAVYFFLAFGSAIYSVTSFFAISGFFSWPFAWNRFEVAILNPISGLGTVGSQGAYVTFTLFGIAGVVSTFSAGLLFLIVSLLRLAPMRIRNGLAAPIFWGLGVLRFFEVRKISLPVTVIIFSVVATLIAAAGILKLRGF
jgi:hypothetical protein